MKPSRPPKRKTELRRATPEAVQRWRQRSARKRAGRPKANRAFRDLPRVPCPVCGERLTTDPHHLLKQTHIRNRARYEQWSRERLIEVLSDLRNRLAVCRLCNLAQESDPNPPMRRGHVTEAAWAFARELGEWAVVRLERDYPA